MARRILVCLAFATLCFFRTWVELGEGYSNYFDRYAPLYTFVIPILCCEAAIALSVLAAWEFCRRRKWLDSPLVHWLFLLACLVPLRGAYLGVYRLAGQFLPFHAPQFVRHRYFWVALVLIGLPLVVLRLRAVSRMALSALLYSIPVLLVVFGWSMRGVFQYPPSAYSDGKPAPRGGPPPSPVRVVWIIFDEMSQSLAFDQRPASVRMQNFDRFKAETFYASSAQPPSPDTLISLPSLTLGMTLAKAKPAGPRNLLLWKSAKSQPFSWQSAPNVFDSARQLGFNTAAAGWYHPYSRILNRSLNQFIWTTQWFPNGIDEPADQLSLPAAVRYRSRGLAMFLVAGQRGNDTTVTNSRVEMMRRFTRLVAKANEFAGDASLGLVLLHLPVPHPPSLYSRTEETMETRGRISYLDNLALADRTLGDLRKTMEQAGVWERTAVLISSDHGLRPEMWRPYAEWTPEDEAVSQADLSGVPFLLKLPGPQPAMEYRKPFNTVITKRLITEILAGRLAHVRQVPGLIQCGEDCLETNTARVSH